MRRMAERGACRVWVVVVILESLAIVVKLYNRGVQIQDYRIVRASNLTLKVGIKSIHSSERFPSILS